jgi:uncharacterized membrane protein YeaQ/YmgE (transglycosylase-associated protein family)
MKIIRRSVTDNRPPGLASSARSLGFRGSIIGLGKVESFELGGIFVVTIGAIILLIVYRLLRKRT